MNKEFSSFLKIQNVWSLKFCIITTRNVKKLLTTSVPAPSFYCTVDFITSGHVDTLCGTCKVMKEGRWIVCNIMKVIQNKTSFSFYTFLHKIHPCLPNITCQAYKYLVNLPVSDCCKCLWRFTVVQVMLTLFSGNWTRFWFLKTFQVPSSVLTDRLK